MADMENQEDQKISECLQEAFGYSDEQLLKQLDHVNENFKDVSFAGAEERLMKRFMERKAEMERKATEAEPETTKSDARTGAIPEITAGAEECTLVEENRPELLELEKKQDEKQDEKQNKKKIVRFGKKKVLATAALVAVIAGMLGGTAIGKKNYFFRKSGSVAEISLDNDKNMLEDSKLELIYKDIEEKVDFPLLLLGYCPENMEFDGYDIYADGVEIRFTYYNKFMYLVQRKKETASSTGIVSDRETEKSVMNRWMNQKIEYSVNTLDDGTQECGAIIPIKNYYYCIYGSIPEEKFKEILKYLYFS